MKFGEMMLSYNVKEELESWLAKLAEVKVRLPSEETVVLIVESLSCSVKSIKGIRFC